MKSGDGSITSAPPSGMTGAYCFTYFSVHATSVMMLVFTVCFAFWALQMRGEYHSLGEDAARLRNGNVELLCAGSKSACADLDTPAKSAASTPLASLSKTANQPSPLSTPGPTTSSSPTSSPTVSPTTLQPTASPTSGLDHLLTDYVALSNHIDQQRELMAKAAYANYSHYYQDLFYQNTTTSNNITIKSSRGKLAFSNPQQPQGWNTLKSRLKMKILSVQEGLLLASEPNQQPSLDPQVKWIHTVAGHSSSAGHGNFENESYGAVMTAALYPLFQSIGIQLETRTYGMSGKPSSPEMALCQEAILGTDVDMVTWDYALTDGPNLWNFEYWMQRASLLTSHPVLIERSPDKNYHDQLGGLYQQHPHLPFLAINEDVVADMEAAVPDSLKDFNLPPLLQYLRCNSPFLEQNLPCTDHKFKPDICPDRHWMKGWHPGFKRLALFGNLYALFLVDALQEAVGELQKEMPAVVTLESVQKRRQELILAKEQQVQRTILSAKYRPTLGRKGSTPPLNQIFPGLNTTWLYQSRGLCRTMRLPSQQRYKGISTGHPVIYNDLVPEEGLEHEEISASFGAGNNSRVENALDLALGYDEKTRYSQRNCSLTTNLDYSDYMYVTDTWRKAVLPSEAEEQEYFSGNKQQLFQGIVIICPLDCSRQTKACYGDEVRGQWKDLLEVQVNGLPAVAMTQFINNECGILSHKGGFVFPPREKDRKYDLRMRIKPHHNNEINKILQISSIVLI